MRAVARSTRVAGGVMLLAALAIVLLVAGGGPARIAVTVGLALVLSIPGVIVLDFSRMLHRASLAPKRVRQSSGELWRDAATAVQDGLGEARAGLMGRLLTVMRGLFSLRSIPSAAGATTSEVLSLGRLVSPLYLVAVVASLAIGALVVLVAAALTLLKL